MQRLRRTGIALIAVLALGPFLTSSSSNANNAYANGIVVATPLNPSLHNLDDEEISTVEVDQQAMIRGLYIITINLSGLWSSWSKSGMAMA